MSNYQTFLPVFERRFKAYLLGERKRYALHSPKSASLFRALEEFSLRGSKRIRPYLVFLGWRACGRNRPAKSLWSLAIAYELWHSFALIHDDIVDRAETRRGGKTLHRILGESSDEGVYPERAEGVARAMLVGDLALAIANGLVSSIKTPHRNEIQKRSFAMQKEMISGEIEELFLCGKRKTIPAKKDIIRVITRKSAGYSFSYPLCLGALLGGDPRLAFSLFRVGDKLGIAFQIMNDLAPYRKPESDYETYSDLREGRMNFVAYHFFKERPQALSGGGFGSQDAQKSQLRALRRKIQHSSAPAKATSEAASYLKSAERDIMKLRVKDAITCEFAALARLIALR